METIVYTLILFKEEPQTQAVSLKEIPGLKLTVKIDHLGIHLIGLCSM